MCVCVCVCVCVCAGNAGWGIAWYINDTLIPELVVQRGKTYTFIVFGGDDSTQSGNYHPFYITDSESGGYLLNDGDKVYIHTKTLSTMHTCTVNTYLILRFMLYSV